MEHLFKILLQKQWNSELPFRGKFELLCLRETHFFFFGQCACSVHEEEKTWKIRNAELKDGATLLLSESFRSERYRWAQNSFERCKNCLVADHLSQTALTLARPAVFVLGRRIVSVFTMWWRTEHCRADCMGVGVHGCVEQLIFMRNTWNIFVLIRKCLSLLLFSSALSELRRLSRHHCEFQSRLSLEQFHRLS